MRRMIARMKPSRTLLPTDPTLMLSFKSTISAMDHFRMSRPYNGDKCTEADVLLLIVGETHPLSCVPVALVGYNEDALSQSPDEIVKLLLRLFLGVAIALLQSAGNLIALAGEDVEVV